DKNYAHKMLTTKRNVILPPENQSYMGDIVKTVKAYKNKTVVDCEKASDLGVVTVALKTAPSSEELKNKKTKLEKELGENTLAEINSWNEMIRNYSSDNLIY